MNTLLLKHGAFFATLAALGATACNATDPNRANVTVAFSAAPAASISAASMGETSGTLTVTGVFAVVDEFKLEGNDGACDAPEPAPDCAKFEAEPHLLSLSLGDEEVATVIEETAPPGTFTSLKFETKARDNAAVQAQIRAAGITDWPADASLLLTGVFTPDGATEGVDVRVFFDAEVKIVMDLPNPLVIASAADPGQIISIEVDPRGWFAGQDLAALDFVTSGEVHKLEVKLEDGFTRIELERR